MTKVSKDIYTYLRHFNARNDRFGTEGYLDHSTNQLIFMCCNTRVNNFWNSIINLDKEYSECWFIHLEDKKHELSHFENIEGREFSKFFIPLEFLIGRNDYFHVALMPMEIAARASRQSCFYISEDYYKITELTFKSLFENLVKAHPLANTCERIRLADIIEIFRNSVKRRFDKVGFTYEPQLIVDNNTLYNVFPNEIDKNIFKLAD